MELGLVSTGLFLPDRGEDKQKKNNQPIKSPTKLVAPFLTLLRRLVFKVLEVLVALQGMTHPYEKLESMIIVPLMLDD